MLASWYGTLLRERGAIRHRRLLAHETSGRAKGGPVSAINKSRREVHHDALEFPDGQIVLLPQLCEAQHATVLQLPASPRAATAEESETQNLSDQDARAMA